jgi:hypothetical protein
LLAMPFRISSYSAFCWAVSWLGGMSGRRI